MPTSFRRCEIRANDYIGGDCRKRIGLWNCVMSKSSVVRVGLIQHACPVDATVAANLETSVGLIQQAAEQGAQVICTQELFTSSYFPQTEDDSRFELAETIPGPTSSRLGELAGRLGVEIIASLFERRAAGVFHNTCILLDVKGRIAGRYRKMHIPDDPGFYEKYYFTPGDLGWQALPTRQARVGILICWDQWFPEAVRLTTLHGAQILFFPTAIGYGSHETPQTRIRQKDAWITVQRAHAVTNGIFICAVNRVGIEGDLEFWGSSFVAEPDGTIIAQSGQDDRQILIADCDLSRIDTQRQGWPFLRDRRIDAYEQLTRRIIDAAPSDC